MLNALQSYQFGAAPLRVLQLAGEPWFAATDVASSLGYRDAANLVRILDDDEKGTHNVSTLGGDQEMLIISESGLYHAIFKSRRDEAKAFRKWVTSEVLPTIRRSGAYSLASADPVKGLAAAVKLVSEARRLGGKVAGREVWNSLALPTLPAIEEVDELDDPWLAQIDSAIEQLEEATTDEMLAAIGVETPDNAMRRRVAKLMRFRGWFPQVVRRGSGVVKVFAPVMGE
jgi:prophage antirepressor-like protein